ncbi:MAG: hypothetical protein AAFQ45_12200 [Pseudomonadota bacterium]
MTILKTLTAGATAAVAAVMLMTTAPSGAKAAAFKVAAPTAAPAAATQTAPVQTVGFKRRRFGVHIHFGHGYRGHGYYRPYRYVPRYRGCGWLKRRWHRTGRHYWKRRYFICRGWW